MANARLHLLPIAAAVAEVPGLDWLTDAERQRLQALTAPARRDSFLAGHWQARWQAAQWLQLDVARIALDTHADGRPLLCIDGDAAPLQLSLSHSSDWLALALADVPVGVDIELPQRVRDWQALARFVFAPDELQRLQDADAAGCCDVFHALWTLKEARGKRSGEGLRPRSAQQVSARPSAAVDAEAWSWAFGSGAVALALEAGAVLEIAGATLAAPAYWRYVAVTEG